MNQAMFEIRRENLRRLVLNKFEGNRAAFSRAAGVHQNQINLLLTDNPDHQRNLGEGLARRMEAGLGLVPGLLDQPSADTPSGPVSVLKSTGVPDHMGGILMRDDMHANAALYDSYLEQFAGKMSSKDNLRFFRVGTRDMEPELVYGDYVLVDVGVQAVTTDGVYVLGHGSDLFLRRIQKLVTGGWAISSPRSEPIKIDTLKDIKAAARVLAVLRVTVL